MTLVLFNNLKNKDKSEAIERLIEHSSPTQDFFFMITLSILTATFGILVNDIAVIIGSMLIAPMLYPLLSLSLGIVMSDSTLISRSFYTIVKSFGLGAVTAAIATSIFSNHFTELTPQIIAQTKTTIPNVMIAITAGFAGTFALVKPKLNENLPGVAISVALITPLAVFGIGLAQLNLEVITGSLVLFLINAGGVIFASMTTFSLMNFYTKRKEAHQLAENVDKQTKEELKKAEKLTKIENQ